ncbi:betaine--homocysteine S-methyltransferase 1 [Cricetulus griseus]|nr:betaine--homocysteine S-methyltransferase 1 [Cricetulus griseus]
MEPVGRPRAKKGILERLDSREVVVGDGGFLFTLEKRGFVKAGLWTPEAVVEHPSAVRQLHTEFLRAGADVLQTFTFSATEDNMESKVTGEPVESSYKEHSILLGGGRTGLLCHCTLLPGSCFCSCSQWENVNAVACDLAREVADGGNALVAGGLCQTSLYKYHKDETRIKTLFRQQLEVFARKNVDFLIAEYFEHVEEAVWAVEALKTSGKPIAATMCIGPEGDLHGVSPGECAVRLVKAGASIVGVNCHFDPATSLQTVKLMKEGLEGARLKAYLMTQPLAYHTPDCSKQGFIDLPEFPFGLEPRVATRWDIQKYAREAYNLGVRYIGGCCGFEPYHIRAIAEELAPERGFLPPASEKHGSWGSGLDMHTKPWIRARARKEYWQNLRIASGRPYNPSMSKPDAWGVTKGTSELMQQKEATTEQQLKELFEKQKFKSAHYRVLNNISQPIWNLPQAAYQVNDPAGLPSPAYCFSATVVQHPEVLNSPQPHKLGAIQLRILMTISKPRKQAALAGKALIITALNPLYKEESLNTSLKPLGYFPGGAVWNPDLSISGGIATAQFEDPRKA